MGNTPSPPGTIERECAQPGPRPLVLIRWRPRLEPLSGTRLAQQRSHILEHVDFQSLLRNDLLQSSVLLVQFPRAPGVIGLHPAVLVTSAVIRLFGDTQLACGLGNRAAAAKQLVGLAQLAGLPVQGYGEGSSRQSHLPHQAATGLPQERGSERRAQVIRSGPPPRQPAVAPDEVETRRVHAHLPPGTPESPSGSG